MRVVDGKREWLVAWSGVDGTGKQWADTWQPTRSLTPDLKHNFFYDRAQRALRVVEVDARPLDTTRHAGAARDRAVRDGRAGFELRESALHPGPGAQPRRPRPGLHS